MQKVADVVISLSKNKINDFEKESMRDFLNSTNDWFNFIGQIMFHKIQLRAWTHIKTEGITYLLPKFVRDSLSEHYDFYNDKRNKRLKCVQNIVKLLNESNCSYCIVKGDYLEKDLFDNTARECNDTDILIPPSELKKIDLVLQSDGYKRGYYDSKTNSIISDRTLDIYFKTNTHQTLPYRKIIENEKAYNCQTIDIQFALTLQKQLNYDVDINKMLSRAKKESFFGIQYNVLDEFDNFVLLCTHLYGEAILFSEICKGKDLQLSKISDIYHWIEKYYCSFDWDVQVKKLSDMRVTIPVAYCLKLAEIVYDSQKAMSIIEKMKVQDWGFMDEYRDANFNIAKWDRPIMERMFSADRPRQTSGLKGV